MKEKKLGKTRVRAKKKSAPRTYKKPSWVPHAVSGEVELCPDCFKVVGERSRYNLVCMLGKTEEGMTVGELTERMKLRQPTITHHLQVLHSVNAVEIEPQGQRRVYRLNRNAHCFEECRIPY